MIALQTISDLRKSDSPEIIKKAGLWLVFFLCIFIPFRSPLSDLTTPAIKAIPDLLIVCFFLWYVVLVRFRLKFIICDWLYLAFLLLGLVSTVFINRVGISSYLLQVRSIGIYYLLFFVLRNFSFGKKEYCQMVNVLQGVVYVLFAFGVVEKIFNKFILFPKEITGAILFWDNFARVYSMLYNPNTYGALLAIVFLMCLFKRLWYGSKNCILIYIVLVISLLLSISRSSILLLGTLLIGLLALLLSRYQNKINWRRTAAGALAVLLFGIAGYAGIKELNSLYTDYQLSTLSPSDPIYDLIKGSSGIGTGDRFQELMGNEIMQASKRNGRLYSLATGWKVFKDHPVFGTGFGTFGSSASLQREPAIYKQYGIQFPFYADNEYIKVLAENGTLGALLYLAFLLSLFWFCRKNLFKILIFLLILGFGLFYTVFEIQIIAMLFWVILSFKDFLLFKTDEAETAGTEESLSSAAAAGS